MADEVGVKFGADVQDAVENVRTLKEEFTHLFELLGVTISIEGIKHYIDAMAELGLQTERTMSMLGLSAEQVGELNGMAMLTGSSVEGLTHSFERLYLGVQRSTRDALNPAAQGLKALGISAKDVTATGGDATAILEIFHDAISKLNPSMNLTAALMAAGGRGMAQLIPLLHLSAAEWIANKDAIHAAQQGFAAAIPGAAETHRNISLLSLSVQSLGIRIFTTLKPAIDLVVTSMTKWVQSLDQKTIQQWALTIVSVTIDGIAYIRKFLIDLMAAYQVIDEALKGTASKAAAVWTGLQIVMNPVGFAIHTLLGSYEKLSPAAKTAGDVAAAAANKAKAAVDEWAKSAKEAISASIMSGASGGGSKEGGGKDVKPLDYNAQAALEIFKTKQEELVAVAQGTLARLKATYDFDAANFSISQQQKVRLTIEATQQEQAIELGALQRIRDAYPKGSKEWEAAELSRVKATEKATTDLLQLNQQFFTTYRNEIGGYVSSVETSWNSSLRDMLAGTMSFGAAMKKVLGDLIIYWIEQLEKKYLFEKATTLLAQIFHVESEGVKTAASLGGEAARLAAKQAGTTAGIAIKAEGTAVEGGLDIGAAMVSIGASLAALFAKLTAFFAFLGPLAPVAAMGVVGGVGAVAYSMLTKHEVGSWNVPGITPALLHPGEMVIPEPFAEAMRKNGGMGGGPNIHITAWDGASVQSWLSQGGAAQIARSLKKTIGSNPSLAPA